MDSDDNYYSSDSDDDIFDLDNENNVSVDHWTKNQIEALFKRNSIIEFNSKDKVDFAQMLLVIKNIHNTVISRQHSKKLNEKDRKSYKRALKVLAYHLVNHQFQDVPLSQANTSDIVQVAAMGLLKECSPLVEGEVNQRTRNALEQLELESKNLKLSADKNAQDAALLINFEHLSQRAMDKEFCCIPQLSDEILKELHYLKSFNALLNNSLEIIFRNYISGGRQLFDMSTIIKKLPELKDMFQKKNNKFFNQDNDFRPVELSYYIQTLDEYRLLNID